MHLTAQLTAQQRNRLFWLLLAATLIVMILMNMVGLPLMTPAAPAGIVSYELAGTLTQVQAILASWDEHARLYAAFGLGFDYVFMLTYAALFGLACRMAGNTLRKERWPLYGLGGLLTRGMWLAAALDAIENLALTVMLLERPAEPWPQVAAVCAWIKFGLLFIGMVYAFYGLTIAFLQRVQRRTG